MKPHIQIIRKTANTDGSTTVEAYVNGKLVIKTYKADKLLEGKALEEDLITAQSYQPGDED